MIRWFAAHRTAANLMMLGFMILGVIAILGIRRETFPEFDSDVVEIRVQYPGATPADVEEEIIRRIEDAIDGVNYIKEVSSEARANIGIVSVEMTTDGELITFISDLQTEVDGIMDFPPLAEEPIVQEQGKTSPVIAIAITGEMPATELKNYAEELKDELQLLPEISQVTISGFSDRQIRIELDQQALQQFNLSIDQVSAIVSRQSIDLPAGDVETRDEDLSIRFTDKRRQADEFNNLILRGSDEGGEIRLGDVASIYTTYENEEDSISFNKKRAALLTIEKTDEEDSLNIFSAVEEFVEKEQAAAPPSVSLTLTNDLASVVQDRLSMLLKNGWQGLILVFLVLGSVFSLRFAFWVAMSLPVSFLGAFVLFPLLGLTINMITMVGLLMAIGLLMDDGIVLSENVMAHHARGKSPLKSVVDGVTEVMPGVFASFLTTLAVFGPLTMVEGEIGKILRVMPLTLILVMSISMIEAFLILPNHLFHAIQHEKHSKQNRIRARIDGAIQKIGDALGEHIVSWAARNRYATAGIAIMIFLSTVSLVAGGVLKFQVFPDLEGDVLEARVLMPQGTPLNRTETVAEQLTNALSRTNEYYSEFQPEGRSLVRNVNVDFATNRSAQEEGPHVATIKADLLPAEIRKEVTMDGLIERWQEETGSVPGAIAVNYTEPNPGPAGNPIEVRLYGKDLEALKAAAIELRNEFETYQGTYNLLIDLRPGKPEIRLKLKQGATRLGLTAQDIADQLRASYFGSTASELIVGQNELEIDVRLAKQDRDSLGDFDNFRITLPDGGRAPLEFVAEISRGRSWGRIARVDGQRVVTVTGDIDTRIANTEAILQDVETNFLPEFRERHPAVSQLSFQGERESGGEAQASMVRNFLLGLIAVYLLLSFLFKSFIEPIIVMSAIPFILVGVIIGHLAMGFPITMPSMMGFFALAGVVVNNSILLVEFVKIRRRENHSTLEAIKLATKQRFRPILLSTSTTLAGLLPLLFETSLQAQVLIPLAVSLVFGLASSTVLVLLILPSLYMILEDFNITAPIFDEIDEEYGHEEPAPA